MRPTPAPSPYFHKQLDDTAARDMDSRRELAYDIGQMGRMLLQIGSVILVLAELCFLTPSCPKGGRKPSALDH